VSELALKIKDSCLAGSPLRVLDQSIKVISILLIRTMSGLADVARMETGTVEVGFSDARFPGRSA